ncbi:MAG: hypothetical protein U0800_04520 [Isosphaeraceae bacterium]
MVDQEPTFLRYLSECGIDLGTEGTLVENRPEAEAPWSSGRRPDHRPGEQKRRRQGPCNPLDRSLMPTNASLGLTD